MIFPAHKGISPKTSEIIGSIICLFLGFISFCFRTCTYTSTIRKNSLNTISHCLNNLICIRYRLSHDLKIKYRHTHTDPKFCIHTLFLFIYLHFLHILTGNAIIQESKKRTQKEKNSIRYSCPYSFNTAVCHPQHPDPQNSMERLAMKKIICQVERL